MEQTEIIYKFVQDTYTRVYQFKKINNMQYFTDRLKSARKMNSLSLQELSDKLDNSLTKQDISRLENGQIKPDSKSIFELSKVLNVATDFFTKQQVLQLEKVAFRKLTKLPVKKQDAVIHQTKEYLERYIELEQLLGIQNKIPFKHEHFPITNEDDIVVAATKLRKDFNIGFDPIYNIVELLEEIGIKVYAVDTDPSFSGMSAKVNDNLMVIVYNNTDKLPLVRKRFTLLRELAHLYLDLSKFGEKESEKLCDQFAGEVLLPSIKLKEYFRGKRETIFISELENIKRYFGISLPAIMYRAKTNNIISEHYHKYFSIKYNQDKMKEKESIGYDGIEQSNRFIQLLLTAVAQEVISTSKASALNNQKLGDFRGMYLDTVSN